jgi:hypothetical protein
MSIGVALPPLPPPFHPPGATPVDVSPPRPPTLTWSTSPGVTARVAVARPPFPASPPALSPPCAPHASTASCVTPAGTVNVWAAPVFVKVTVTGAAPAGCAATVTNALVARAATPVTPTINARPRLLRIPTVAPYGTRARDA